MRYIAQGETLAERAQDAFIAAAEGWITINQLQEQVQLILALGKFEAKALEARLTKLEETRDSGNFR